MSDRINLAELRKATEAPYRHLPMPPPYSSAVLALIDAVEAARDLYELVERDESVGVGLSDRVPSLHLRDALARFEWREPS